MSAALAVPKGLTRLVGRRDKCPRYLPAAARRRIERASAWHQRIHGGIGRAMIALDRVFA
jgi:hypothetical protein